VIKSSRVRWVGQISNAYKIFFRKPEGTRPLGRSRHKWEDNNRMDLMEIQRVGVDCIHADEDRDQ
jgi:hypothetical protein